AGRGKGDWRGGDEPGPRAPLRRGSYTTFAATSGTPGVWLTTVRRSVQEGGVGVSPLFRAFHPTCTSGAGSMPAAGASAMPLTTRSTAVSAELMVTLAELFDSASPFALYSKMVLPESVAIVIRIAPAPASPPGRVYANCWVAAEPGTMAPRKAGS